MINNIKFNKVKKIPSSLEPNSFYFVESGNYAEAFLTTQTGDLKKIGDEGTVTVYEQFEALEDQTEFTLSHLVKETNHYAVFINGLLQPEDFYQIEDNTLIFSEPLGEGDLVALQTASYEHFEASKDQTRFIFSKPEKEDSHYAVYINGLLQPEGFYRIEDNSLIFNEPLGEGDSVALQITKAP